ncbi:helix-turn-helix domain-containing protein [Paractinoplanes brasiliensis]|uniref:PucR-like helix-turn-helix protein n=1 Tax=Paractinoplanes brasiliensis TaxID=52695 RepID=A0A4R6JQQ8_9ACTN|nr:helix-turn-helix domain-containing protein [Actinoplanes brasiliensis]TDO36965.1 PucR-like helix-turn-helix protein [Actinoplanes brasiliensis]GID30487.1 hypothetical protein Abr02nite_54700 [Actinoplanes brasiliensis]
MKDLAVRLEALDADAGAALRVIAYFDSLTESRAGLQAIVRGAAVLAGVPARLDDAERRVHVRITPAGVSEASAEPADTGWPRTEIGARAVLALERTGEPGPVDAMILERAAGAARAVLDRTRGRAPAEDPALVELIVDAAAPLSVREVAARKLGLDGPVRAAARPAGPLVLPAGAAVPPGRIGLGPAVPVADLPASYAAARVALRFAADGTDDDPGPPVVAYESLGGLALLAAAPLPEAIPDLDALAHAMASAPWALATLQAFADTASLRAAATALRLHHSTLQDRIIHLEHLLGWPTRTTAGKLRLQIALALRRLARHP